MLAVALPVIKGVCPFSNTCKWEIRTLPKPRSLGKLSCGSGWVLGSSLEEDNRSGLLDLVLPGVVGLSAVDCHPDLWLPP